MSGIMYNSLDHCSIVSVSTISSGNWVSAKNHLYARSHHLQDGVDSRTSNLSFKSLNCLSIVSVITVSCSGCFWVTHLLSFHSSMILFCDPHILGHPVFYPAILSPPCGYCTCDKSIHCYPRKLLDWIYRSIVVRNCCCLFWEAVCRSSVIFCWNIKQKNLLAYDACYNYKHAIYLVSDCLSGCLSPGFILCYFPKTVWGFSSLVSYFFHFLRHPVSLCATICFLTSFRPL